jgi:translation elongation factor P/translation initiation factor 5A
MQLLYIEGDRAFLQDEETFEQMDLNVGTLGVARYYLEVKAPNPKPQTPNPKP